MHKSAEDGFMILKFSMSSALALPKKHPFWAIWALVPTQIKKIVSSQETLVKKVIGYSNMQHSAKYELKIRKFAMYLALTKLSLG